MHAYVKHVTRERARLRHSAFGERSNREMALDILQKQPGIAGIKQGPESFLLFMEPEANLGRICEALEEKLPEIRSETPGSPSQCCSKRKHSFCKDVLKTYLATGITTVTLAALGLHHWHAIFGCIFTAFAVDHVWVRRKAL